MPSKRGILLWAMALDKRVYKLNGFQYIMQGRVGRFPQLGGGGVRHAKDAVDVAYESKPNAYAPICGGRGAQKGKVT